MSVTRGFKRIILILAMFAMVPGFFVGWITHEESLEEVYPEHIDKITQGREAGFSEFEIREYLRGKDLVYDGLEEDAPEIEGVVQKEHYIAFSKALGSESPRKVRIYRYRASPRSGTNSKSIAAGVVGAVAFFLVVLVCLRITLRVGVWVADAFRAQG